MRPPFIVYIHRWHSLATGTLPFAERGGAALSVHNTSGVARPTSLAHTRGPALRVESRRSAGSGRRSMSDHGDWQVSGDQQKSNGSRPELTSQLL